MYDEGPVVEIRISPRQAEELVNRLTDDMEFRERLTQDPTAELGRYGISIPAELLPERVELPSPDELRRLRVELEAEDVFGYLGKPFILFCLILSGWLPRS
jgi:hypothetical protein